MDKQVTIGVTGCLEGDVLIGPVGFVHPPDAGHAIGYVGAADCYARADAQAIIAPGQEAFIVGDCRRMPVARVMN